MKMPGIISEGSPIKVDKGGFKEGDRYVTDEVIHQLVASPMKRLQIQNVNGQQGLSLSEKQLTGWGYKDFNFIQIQDGAPYMSAITIGPKTDEDPKRATDEDITFVIPNKGILVRENSHFPIGGKDATAATTHSFVAQTVETDLNGNRSYTDVTISVTLPVKSI